MPAARKRRSTAEVNECGSRWKRRPVNANGSPNASQGDAPKMAVVHRSKMTIQFCDWSNFIRGCRLLETAGRVEFFSEEGFVEGDDEKAE
jgi:hypothetical protein